MKGLFYSRKRGPESRNPIRKRIYKARDLTLSVDGATGVGFGTVVLGDLPEGNILILGAVAYMQFTGPTSADLADTWEGDYGVGTTPAGDATLSGDDVDIIASTAIAAATAEASPRTRGIGEAQSIVDNTDGSLEVNLSLLVDDANIGADDIDFTVNGELELVYIVLLDD